MLEVTATCFECNSDLIIENPDPDKAYVCDECIERYLGVAEY